MSKPQNPIPRKPVRAPKKETDLERSARILSQWIKENPDHPEAAGIRAHLARFDAIKLLAEKLKH